MEKQTFTGTKDFGPSLPVKKIKNKILGFSNM